MNVFRMECGFHRRTPYPKNPYKVKRQPTVAAFLEKVFRFYGVLQKLYNVLGGFYIDYNSTIPQISVHKLYKSFHYFLCTFSPSIEVCAKLRKNIHKNQAKISPGF